MADNALATSSRPPPPAAPQLLQRLLGRAILRPPFDWVALRLVAHVYLRLSRGWAAALACEGVIERFLAESGLAEAGVTGGRGLERAVARVRARDAAHSQAFAAWQAGFFGPEARSAGSLAALERSRRAAAHELMASRSGFLPYRRRLAPVAWEVAPPAVVEARHGARLDEPAAAFPLPAQPEVAVSRAMPGEFAEERWLRFPSPVMADEAWAHLYEPSADAQREGGPAPTAIFLHGIGMETEMWRSTPGVESALAARGFRVISAEGPWHGRRRPAGRYGGEPVLGRGPLGLLDLLEAWTAEVAVLIRWARAAGGPVVLTGVSLGALSAQRAASAAAGWPAEARPDALFLVATSGDLYDLAGAGSLARQIGLEARLERAGWREPDLRRWLPLMEPEPGAPLAPGRIVMVLGEHDDLTPYPGGRALAEAWGVPPENLFLRPQGHFSVALGVLNEPGPLDRLAALTEGL